MRRTLRVIALPASLAGAVLVTMLCLWMLAALNLQAVAELENPRLSRSVLVQGQQQQANDREATPQPPESKPPEPETMAFDPDMPSPEPIELEPLDLETTLPTADIPTVRVAVKKRAAPQQPTRRQPTREPAADSPAEDRASQIDQPPRETAGNPSPLYPQREQELGIEATVRMRLLIDESGRVVDVRFVRGPEAFRQAVLQVVRQWRFSPARRGGQAIRIWAVKEVQFRVPRGAQ